MTRIDLSTREWHYLVRPVLPHAPGTEAAKEIPWLAAIRIERAPSVLYAVATDQLTLAAERHPLRARDRSTSSTVPPVHLDPSDVAASLKFFSYTKDLDPDLELIIDQAPVPYAGGIKGWVVTLHRPDDGQRLTMRDRRDPSAMSSLESWREVITKALTRPRGRSLDGLDIRGHLLGRWKDAARGTERLRLYTGAEPGQPILITVESHFAGLLTVPLYLDNPAASRSELPWTSELLPAGIGADGEREDGDE